MKGQMRVQIQMLKGQVSANLLYVSICYEIDQQPYIKGWRARFENPWNSTTLYFWAANEDDALYH